VDPDVRHRDPLPFRVDGPNQPLEPVLLPEGPPRPPGDDRQVRRRITAAGARPVDHRRRQVEVKQNVLGHEIAMEQ
jgi:hypothetical protein